MIEIGTPVKVRKDGRVYAGQIAVPETDEKIVCAVYFRLGVSQVSHVLLVPLNPPDDFEGDAVFSLDADVTEDLTDDE